MTEILVEVRPARNVGGTLAVCITLTLHVTDENNIQHLSVSAVSVVMDIITYHVRAH